MLNKDQEKNLIEKCVFGEKQAWDQFVSQYSKLIYSFIHKTLQRCGQHNNSDLVEDAFQEVFLSLMKDNCSKLNSFCGKNNCSISTWLGVVTTNLVLDILRRDSRYGQKYTSLDATTESENGNKKSLIEITADGTSSAADNLDVQQQLKLLNESINKMPATDQLLFKLIYKDGLALEEVAQIMHKSIDALYMHKKRVLDKLKESLKKYDVSF